MKHVVKNERGEWLGCCLSDDLWVRDRKLRFEHNRLCKAFAAARCHGGKVYRVRKLTAQRERDAIVRLIRNTVASLGKDQRLMYAFERLAEKIEALEHRRKHAER